MSSLSILHSPERFTELSREERRREEIEVTWGKKGERAIKPVITPLSKNGY